MVGRAVFGWDEPITDPPSVHVRVLAGLGSVSRVSVCPGGPPQPCFTVSAVGLGSCGELNQAAVVQIGPHRHSEPLGTT